MTPRNKALWAAYISTILQGLTPVLARHVSVSSFELVFWRVLFAALSILIVSLISKRELSLASRSDWYLVGGVGALLAVQWCAFYQALIVSTIAVAEISFSIFPVFVSMFEPLIFKEQFRYNDLGMALIVVAGVLLMVPEYAFTGSTFVGVCLGMTSAVLYAFISMLNRKAVIKNSSDSVAFYQYLIAALCLLPVAILWGTGPTLTDFGWLILIATIGTSIAHTLLIYSMKNISAYLCGLIVNACPIVAIILAIFLLDEVPTLRIILGGTIVLSATYISTRQNHKRYVPLPEPPV